ASGRLSTMARPRGADWLEDEMKVLRAAGVDVVVSMLTHAEAAELDLVTEREAAERAGVQFVNLPTPDRGVPEREAFRGLVSSLGERLGRGEHVVVHGRMGIGRASMVACAVLIADGVAPNKAWQVLGQARGLEIPDTPQQRAWVEATVTGS